MWRASVTFAERGVFDWSDSVFPFIRGTVVVLDALQHAVGGKEMYPAEKLSAVSPSSMTPPARDLRFAEAGFSPVASALRAPDVLSARASAAPAPSAHLPAASTEALEAAPPPQPPQPTQPAQPTRPPQPPQHLPQPQQPQQPLPGPVHANASSYPAYEAATEVPAAATRPLCYFHLRRSGGCRNGKACRFSHGAALRPSVPTAAAAFTLTSDSLSHSILALPQHGRRSSIVACPTQMRTDTAPGALTSLL